jgi:hypothetical protein
MEGSHSCLADTALLTQTQDPQHKTAALQLPVLQQGTCCCPPAWILHNLASVRKLMVEWFLHLPSQGPLQAAAAADATLLLVPTAAGTSSTCPVCRGECYPSYNVCVCAWYYPKNGLRHRLRMQYWRLLCDCSTDYCSQLYYVRGLRRIYNQGRSTAWCKRPLITVRSSTTPL